MFGADTALVFEAIQMAAVTAGITGAAVYAIMRLRRKSNESGQAVSESKSNLEERVEVLERIATDQSISLADEFEALRETTSQGVKSKQLEGQSQ